MKNQKEMKEKLSKMNKSEVMSFIREVLKYDRLTLRHHEGDISKEHKRFEMSGYNSGRASCVSVYNQSIINEFAYLGIYDYFVFLSIDFYKGFGVLYYRLWSDGIATANENIMARTMDFSGMGTTDIIYEILKLSVLSTNGTRRRG